jgi:hypothetical protein
MPCQAPHNSHDPNTEKLLCDCAQSERTGCIRTKEEDSASSPTPRVYLLKILLTRPRQKDDPLCGPLQIYHKPPSRNPSTSPLHHNRTLPHTSTMANDEYDVSLSRIHNQKRIHANRSRAQFLFKGEHDTPTFPYFNNHCCTPELTSHPL